jgi:hypothetical protein
LNNIDRFGAGKSKTSKTGISLLKPVTLEICFFPAAPASGWKRNSDSKAKISKI